MARTLFISETYVKENSPIDENVDQKLIRPMIWDTQSDYIEPILGTDLYNELIAAIDADNRTADQIELTDVYIAEAHEKWVTFEFMLIGLYKYRNKSITKGNSENSQPVDQDEEEVLREHWRKKAERRSERLRLFLCANTKKFPAYLTNVDVDDIQPKDSGYSSSLYLGTHERKDRCTAETKL